MNARPGVGLIGAGNIAPEYLLTLTGSDRLEVRAVADLDAGRAAATAAPFGLEAMQPEELLARPDIDIIVNLTVPAAHAQVSRAALLAGKHVHSEKPIATTRGDAIDLLRLASSSGLLITCGPDTFMGAAGTRARALLASGVIGEVVGASATFAGSGPEAWHPNPDFFFAPGAGPLLDMGPYYVTHLVKLLGPVARVSGMARASWSERRPTVGPNVGRAIPVSTPTHVTALLEFESGPLVTLTCSFDMAGSTQPHIEVYGKAGSMTLPDPNRFGGSLSFMRTGEPGWTVEACEQPPQLARGMAVIDLAECIVSGSLPAADAQDALHVLDILLSILESAASGDQVIPAARP